MHADIVLANATKAKVILFTAAISGDSIGVAGLRRGIRRLAPLLVSQSKLAAKSQFTRQCGMPPLATTPNAAK